MKNVDMSTSVFYERYQPNCVEDVILPESLKIKLQKYVDNKDIPNLGLFSSIPGTGKSSTAHAIIKEIDGEAIWLNASKTNGIDVVRGKIDKFASQCSFDGGIKIVVMDEFDNFSPDGQKAFRGFMSEYTQNCRFIFTGNYKGKIIEALLNRLEIYDFNSFNKKEMIKPIFDRLKFILDNEGIKYDQKDLVPVINTYYPSVRSMVGALQKFSKDGEFKVDESDLNDASVYDKIMGLVAPTTYTDMIVAVNNLNAPENMFTFLYNNAGKYFDPTKYPNVVLIIAKYQHMSESVRDKNLNLSAALTELLPHKGK